MAIDEDSDVDLRFLEFSQAFDAANQRILCDKFVALGVSEHLEYLDKKLPRCVQHKFLIQRSSCSQLCPARIRHWLNLFPRHDQ